MKLAILIHGFNVTKPELTVGKLKPFLEYHGYKVVMFRYGWLGLWGVRTKNKKLAKQVASLTRRYAGEGYEVEVFCHSNGASITYLSTAFGAEINGVVCVNPALQRNMNPCPQATFVHVYYNDDDLPVKLGKWLRWITPLAKSARPWGEMGRYGYNGGDSNVLNIDTKHDFEERAVGHSGVFKEPEINFFGQIIAELADKKVGS